MCPVHFCKVNSHVTNVNNNKNNIYNNNNKKFITTIIVMLLVWALGVPIVVKLRDMTNITHSNYQRVISSTINKLTSKVANNYNQYT